MSAPAGLLRHVAACTGARLPGDRLRLHVAGRPCGWVRPDVAALLAPGTDPVCIADGPALEAAATRLTARGHVRPRGERFAIRADADGACLGGIDRGCLPVLGLQAHNAHLNGLVREADGLHLWVATRAAHKEVGPGKLDHLVAGGIPLGLTPRETLLKEAAEEAGLPAGLAALATPARSLALAIERPEGLRRETLHCFDLVLPRSFTPEAVDGEVAGFALWPMRRVVDTLRTTDAFVYDAALAVLDLALRVGALEAAEAGTVGAALLGCVAG